jgi:transglutaminase/protease-like cytokinesis protein 3
MKKFIKRAFILFFICTLFINSGTFTGVYAKAETLSISYEDDDYNVYYDLSLKQTKTLKTKMKEVLKSLNLNNMTEYEKILAIHDYIVENVSYDLTYKYETAYDALIKKKSVCLGYALLAEGLYNMAGIPCVVITGTAFNIWGSGYHAWNIVKFNGKWYNIDLTWDDPVSTDGKQHTDYSYFLKNDKTFNNDHRRDSYYNTKAFKKKYPISKYNINMIIYAAKKLEPDKEIEIDEIDNEKYQDTYKIEISEDSTLMIYARTDIYNKENTINTSLNEDITLLNYLGNVIDIISTNELDYTCTLKLKKGVYYIHMSECFDKLILKYSLL